MNQLTRSTAVWFMIGGLALFIWPILVLLNIYHLSQVTMFLIVFSFPHFLLSSVVYYSQKDLSRSRPIFSYVFPVALFAGLMFAMHYSVTMRNAICQIGVALLLHHVSMQAYGVAIFYSPKTQGFKSFKYAMLLNAWAWALTAWVYQQDVGAKFPAFKTFLNPLPIPVWGTKAALSFSLLTFFLCVAVWFATSLRRAGFEKSLMTWTPLLALIVWFTPMFAIAGIGLVAVFHGLQYLPFAWMKFNRNRFAIKVSVALMIATGLAAYAMFEAIPRYLSMTYYGASGAAIAAIYVFLNVHHFAIERVLWTRKNFYEQEDPSQPLNDKSFSSRKTA